MSHYSEIADCFRKKYEYAKCTFTGETSLGIDRGGWLNDHSRTLELLIDCICEHVQKFSDKEKEELRTKIEAIEKLKTDLESSTIPLVFARLFQEEFEKTGLVKHELLTNSPSEKKIAEKIVDIIKGSKSKLIVVGWIDAYFLPQLTDAKNRGIEIVILTKKLEDRSPQSVRDGVKDNTTGRE